MEQESTQNRAWISDEAVGEESDAAPRRPDALIREMRRKAKRRKRLVSWMLPLVLFGMAGTLFIVNRFDIRLSLTIFAATACIVIGGLLKARFQWKRMANEAIVMQDIRAIGPLLATLNSTDDNASEDIEPALIELLPRVERLSQLSRQARRDLNRLLLHEEGQPLRCKRAYNARLIYVALRTVARLHDNLSLPAVRRLAEGYGPMHPVAIIRDLAYDILPDLEESAALLRPAQPLGEEQQTLLRGASRTDARTAPEELLRCADPASRAISTPAFTRRTTSCETADTVGICSSSVRSV